MNAVARERTDLRDPAASPGRTVTEDSVTDSEVVAALRGRVVELLRELDAAYGREEQLIAKLRQSAKKHPGSGRRRIRRTMRRQMRRARRLADFLLSDPRARKFIRLSLRNPVWAIRTVREKLDRRRRMREGR